MIPPVYEPVPHEISLRIGRWVQFRLVVPLRFVMYGRADVGEVTKILDPISNEFFKRQAELRDAKYRK